MKEIMIRIIKWLGWFIVHYGAMLFSLLAAICTFAFKERLDMEKNDKALSRWMEEHYPDL